LRRAEYDAKTKRAYVEFRGRDGDAVVAAIFSFQTIEKLSKGLRPELVRLTRHVLKGPSKLPSKRRPSDKHADLEKKRSPRVPRADWTILGRAAG
jgi:hypothetical protein